VTLGLALLSSLDHIALMDVDTVCEDGNRIVLVQVLAYGSSADKDLLAKNRFFPFADIPIN
jgi:hypothetical protein